MKKEEAKQFVIDELKKGATETEIKTVLLEQDKIGSNNPTEAVVNDIFDLGMKEFEALQNADKETQKPEEVIPQARKGNVYEVWRVKVNKETKTEKQVEKIKEVLLLDEQAVRLNAAAMQDNNYVIKYFKK